jgi:hypothetical protein
MQAWEIENRGFLASAAPPLAGFFIEDQSNPGAQIEVGLFTSLAAINGLEDNADGTQAGLLLSRRAVCWMGLFARVRCPLRVPQAELSASLRHAEPADQSGHRRQHRK